MHVIPVIDLQGGLVVRGAGGNRAAYRPIETPLSNSPEPLAIVGGFLEVHPFDTLYIADLDAIQGGVIQSEVLSQIRAHFPSLTLWIDCGIRTEKDFKSFQLLNAGCAVLGSESLLDLELLHESGVILSLDFKHGLFLGVPELLSAPSIWPNKLIVMSLHEVGANRGPDFEQLASVASSAGPSSQIYAAGGVRGPEDLRDLVNSGVAGALVSSALHARRLEKSDFLHLNARA